MSSSQEFIASPSRRRDRSVETTSSNQQDEQETTTNNRPKNSALIPTAKTPSPQIPNTIITFNCGGQLISLQSSKAVSKFPDSFLSNLILVANDPYLSTSLDKDKNGNILLDRDPRMFLCVVNFCRGYLNVGPVNDEELESLLLEADYWCLPQLRVAVEDKIGMAISPASSVSPPPSYQKLHFIESPPPEVVEKMNHFENQKFLDEYFGSSSSSSMVATNNNHMKKNENGNDDDDNDRDEVKSRLDFVYNNPFFKCLSVPSDLRFLKGPGVKMDGTRVRNSFCVGVIGNGQHKSNEYSLQEELHNKNNNNNNSNSYYYYKPSQNLIQYPHRGVSFYDAGSPMMSGVHTLNIEVLRCEYLGVGIMPDPVGSGNLALDSEFHRSPGCIGYYYTGVFYSNTSTTPFKEENLAKFGAGSVIQLRLDMDNRFLEFFINGSVERMQHVGSAFGRVRFVVVMKHDTCVTLISKERAAYLIGRFKAEKIISFLEKKRVEDGQK